jgi:hypothetical protein
MTEENPSLLSGQANRLAMGFNCKNTICECGKG